MMTTIDHYINSIGNPSFYKAHGDMEALSKQLRSNTAIVWIALKSITVLKQAPSLAFFMTKSNPNAFFKACRDTVDDPIAMYEKALEIFPQLSKPMEREIAELYEATDAKGIEALHKMGRIGFYPVKTMDRFVKTVGILAVYESHGGEANHEVAARKAAEITLRTQPAALPKDLARLYTSHEFLNWSVMFTNQLNQIWNIGTYEVPAAIKDGRIMSAIGSMVSLGAAAVGIWSITNGEIPDEPEDIEDALYSQITSSMPLFGRYIEARRRGFDPDPPAPVMAVVGLANAVSKFAEGDFMGAAEEALFPAGVSLGLPIGGAEDLYDWLGE